MSESSEMSDARKQRIAGWLAGGSIAASHVVAGAVAFACLVIAPLGFFTLCFVGAIAFAIVTNGDIGGPLFYPLGAFMIVSLGLACTLIVSVLGLTMDLVRRWLRWPIWTSLAAVVALAVCVPLAAAIVWPERWIFALVVGALCLGVFTTHWIPLALSEGAQKLVLWMGRGISARLRKRSIAPGR